MVLSRLCPIDVTEHLACIERPQGVGGNVLREPSVVIRTFGANVLPDTFSLKVDGGVRPKRVFDGLFFHVEFESNATALCVRTWPWICRVRK